MRRQYGKESFFNRTFRLWSSAASSCLTNESTFCSFYSTH
jgi:hypothetical protein